MTGQAHSESKPLSRDVLALVQWTARIGSVTAEALAHIEGTSVASARARLGAAAHRRLLTRHRLLVDRPALYTVTAGGARAAGLGELDPGRVSPSNSLHMIACANAAAALARGYPDQCIVGERELRREERLCGAAVASAILRRVGGERPLLHRPDLVLRRSVGDRVGQLAVEVELTIKAPRRLQEICRAWARSLDVGGVLYLAAPAVERALHRAIEATQAEERIVVVSLEMLCRWARW